jgi:NHL repeat
MRSTVKFNLLKRSIRRFHVCLLLQIFLSALLPSSAWAQVSFTGSLASGNFGAQAIGSPSAAVTLNFSVSSGTTVGSVAVVTTGIAGLDFANVTGSTCTAKVYSSTTTCSVNVTFTPTAAGLRMGAVVFYSKASSAGTVLRSVQLYGIGMGPQIAYGPGTLLVIDAASFNGRAYAAGLQNPRALVADAAGNLFIVDDDSAPTSYRLVKVPASGATPVGSDPSVNGESLYLPSCVAIDGAGDLFIGDFYGRIVEVPTGGGAATAFSPVVNGIAMNYPSGIAVDGAGDLFIADYINNRVLKVPAGGGAASAIDPAVNGVSLQDPRGVAVDAAGDLFIADLTNDRVIEVPAGGGAATAIGPNVDGIGLVNPTGIAMDAAGDLFISDGVNHRVVELPVGGGAAVSIDEPLYDQGLGEIYSVALDSGGDLFMVEGGLEGGQNIVEELQRAKPPVLNFPALTAVGSTDSTDGLQTAQIVNIGNQPLTLVGIGYPVDFPEGHDSNACTSSSKLIAGQECDVAVEFSPLNSGALAENVSLTDNALNGAGAQQSIPVTGTGEALAALTSPAPGSVLPGPKVTFIWTASAAAKYYWLSVGSTGVGSNNLFNTGRVPSTSCTVGLPANGQKVYVRLITYFGTVQLYTDYVFTAVTPAAVTSPVPSSVLPGSGVTFAWQASVNATGYTMWFGTSGVGSYNLKTTAETTASSTTVTGLPTNSQTIYVRLCTYFNSSLTYNDYTYTAAPPGSPATMITPAVGSTLSSSSVSFTWTLGSEATEYQLWLGLGGPGSSSLYVSGWQTTTTATVASLPANGATVYARLFSMVNGATQYNDYTYLEAAAGKPAAMISPAAGSTLGASGVKFTWTSSVGATQYQLWLGTTGAGSSSLYASGWSTATSTTVASLPAKGVTVYARLYSTVNGMTVYNDYTYTEQ